VWQGQRPLSGILGIPRQPANLFSPTLRNGAGLGLGFGVPVEHASVSKPIDPEVAEHAVTLVRAPPGQQPIPSKTDQPNGLAADALNPQGY
jgi:hypothetical protein